MMETCVLINLVPSFIAELEVEVEREGCGVVVCAVVCLECDVSMRL